jgi:serine O-acetyltransferase
MFATFRHDLAAAKERDPAARSSVEVALFYPGVHAMWAHRIAHGLWNRKLRLAGRGVSHLSRFITGIDIHPGARIGPGVFIDHGMGVVIGETAQVGADVTLYHGVTLGGTSLEPGKRHPTVGDRVTVGAGAKILGAITIGEDSRVGANAVVVTPVPANAVVVGVPGQVVARSRRHHPGDRPDLDHTRLPDLIGVTLQSLMARVDSLEARAQGKVTAEPSGTPIHRPSSGVWHGEDFAI